jgi:hypothetical protein
MRFLEDISLRQKYRTAARLVIIVLAAGALYVFSVMIQEREYSWSLIPAALLALLSVAEFVVADLVLDKRFPPHSARFLERLQRKLGSTSIHQEIMNTLDSCVAGFKGCDQSRISSTVHFRVDINHDEGTLPALIQLSDYTRSGLGGRRWRVIQATKGLAGRCLRQEQLVWVNFRSEQEYRSRMVEEFGFTKDEVDDHTSTARSYLAIPLRNASETVGVLYFFSTEPQVFPLAANQNDLRSKADVITGFLRAAEIL